MSANRKSRVRDRLKEVDSVIETIRASGVKCAALTRALELPTEAKMRSKDKYTTFSRTAAGHRKSVHKVPHFTKAPSEELRINPKGF